MKVSFDEIKEWPVTTNRIRVMVDEKAFFSEYAIVSYYSANKEFKNLAYEQLSDLPFISVAGIRARWDTRQMPFVKFFVLAKKDNSYAVLNSVREYERICSKIDCLDEYNQILKQRIFASLAINSLGGLKTGQMMYNDGKLLICDDRNFLIPKSRKELVCLKVEVNEYLNLIAKTTSFSSPRNIDELRHKHHCVFQVGDDILGQWWSGQSIKPVVIRKDINVGKFDLDKLYVQKKRFSDNHNMVPYWPYNPENYTHGRLFAISQVVDSVNERFAGIVNLQFAGFEVLLYDEYKTDKTMLRFLLDYLKEKRIYIENPFGDASKALIQEIEERLQEVMENTIIFPLKPNKADLIIKLCEPKEEDSPHSFYSQSLDRLAYEGIAMQHVVFYNNPKDDAFAKAEARRVLIELLVKDCLIKRCLPLELCNLIKGWEFVRYKIHDGFVLGARMELESNNSVRIEDFGFSNTQSPVDFESFSHNSLHFDDYDRIRGSRDYMAMLKKGNVYLIIDTDEIPILDVSLIDETYAEILSNTLPLSVFKRKKEVHKYLRGYIGLHLWKEDGLYGEPNASYAYISGINSENMQIMKSTKMDRMPRVRRLFVLHIENEDVVDDDIREIVAMLKYGFGRWNEMMTYPFPFKFLKEYLDGVSEMAFSKHWNEITYK
ncbi:MAG: hypothetical protein IJ622_01030 [Bacteroidales bacterium]|nr:hypothetical protein [Bacteroidales bacterium]